MASLDFDAPLLSVRRARAAPISPSPAAATRFPLPSYKSYLNSGPVRKPGLVPFSWEHTPGLPKHGPSPPKPPPATTAIDDTERGNSSDDATSSSGSSPFLNCSACGSEDDNRGTSFATDPEVRDLMMARFLPAARAMAAGCESRKPHRGPADASAEEDGPRPLYRQRTESIIPWHTNEEASSSGHEDEAGVGVGEAYADDTAHLLSKSCGLIPAFCFKSSFSLPNTAPAAMSASSRLESLSQSEDENLWEAHWTDPQLRNGSSSFSRSATSPYRNETPRSAFVEGKTFLGFPKSELEIRRTASFNSVESDAMNYWAIANSNGRQHSSGSMSPETDRALSVYSLHKPCATDAKLEFADKEATVEKNQALVVCEKDSAQPQFSEFVDYERSICNDDDQEAPLSMLLLPPPLPKSPSESWLRRTLPTVAAKDRFPQSRFAVQFQPKKQSFRGFSTDEKLETKANSPIF